MVLYQYSTGKKTLPRAKPENCVKVLLFCAEKADKTLYRLQTSRFLPLYKRGRKLYNQGNEKICLRDVSSAAEQRR